MLRDRVIVARLEKDNKAWVQLSNQSSCSHCQISSGCGVSVLGKVLGRRDIQVLALNQINACSGDQVKLILSTSSVVKGAFIVYLLPLVCMFLMGLISKTIFVESESEWNVIISAGIGLVFGFSCAAYYLRSNRFCSHLQAEICEYGNEIHVD